MTEYSTVSAARATTAVLQDDRSVFREVARKRRPQAPRERTSRAEPFGGRRLSSKSPAQRKVEKEVVVLVQEQGTPAETKDFQLVPAWSKLTAGTLREQRARLPKVDNHPPPSTTLSSTSI